MVGRELALHDLAVAHTRRVSSVGRFGLRSNVWRDFAATGLILNAPSVRLSWLSANRDSGAKAMNYVNKVIQTNESISARGKLHWIIYIPGITYMFIAIMLCLMYLGVEQSEKSVIGPVAGISTIISIISLFRAWFVRWTTEIAVTNRRIIYKRGFVSRKTIEMNMDKVESVDVDQTIIGRMLNFGTITIRGTGAGIEPLRRISMPLDLRNAITSR